jgi:hypothetical protein
MTFSKSFKQDAILTPLSGIVDARLSTSALNLPQGTTAQRPINPPRGTTRVNTTLNVVEMYNKGSWTILYSLPYAVDIYAWGGGGAGGTVGGWTYGAAGGAGGSAYGQLLVTPNIPYTVVVGAGGLINSMTNAWPGGGPASINNVDNRYGGAGGGYSGVFQGIQSQVNALLIAGGGGGGGSSRAGVGNVGGAGGGETGQAGTAAYDAKGPAYAGKGGTQIAAGVDASSDSANFAGNQGALQGGNPRTNCYGGAGGGGYWGGSAGGYTESNTMGGGGGGSGYFKAATFITATLTAGSGTTPGDSENVLRGSYGTAGGVSSNGTQGVVVFRYLGPQKAQGGYVTSSGGYTIHTFTSSGIWIP